jgi:hypothetical protein
MSASPVFAATPRIGYNTAVAAMDNARTGAVTTGLVSIITAGTNGTRISHVNIVNLDPVGTALADTPQVYRFYLYDGTNYRLVHEVASSTIAAPTTSVAGYQQTVVFTPALVLPNSTWQLFAGITKRTNASADTLFIAHGADL